MGYKMTPTAKCCIFISISGIKPGNKIFDRAKKHGVFTIRQRQQLFFYLVRKDFCRLPVPFLRRCGNGSRDSCGTNTKGNRNNCNG